MILSDNHVHTRFSTDSQTPMEYMINEAIHKNFTSICFTDHMDYDFPCSSPEPEFLLDVNAYLNELNRISPLYNQLKIRRGIELGIKPEVVKKCTDLTSKYTFDFVIGSTHLVDNMDPYYDPYWKDRKELESIKRYYEVTLDNIDCGVDYDVYGHIDYIIRYTPRMKRMRATGNLDEKYINKCINECMELIEEILKKILSNGKGIELNTGGLKYGLGHPNPHEKILKLYHDLGGEIITVGSDAHETKHLGYDFDKVPDILKHCGFKYYTEFENRKPKMISIDS